MFASLPSFVCVRSVPENVLYNFVCKFRDDWDGDGTRGKNWDGWNRWDGGRKDQGPDGYHDIIVVRRKWQTVIRYTHTHTHTLRLSFWKHRWESNACGCSTE